MKAVESLLMASVLMFHPVAMFTSSSEANSSGTSPHDKLYRQQASTFSTIEPRRSTTITCCIALFAAKECMHCNGPFVVHKPITPQMEYGWHSGTRTLSKVGKHLTYILLGTSSMTSALTAYQQNNLSLFHFITSCKCYY
uniref:Secreted protein n=1 Tax=Glossina austeni TaxID=7395 RepID=A0A1A9UZL6_GLOAU